MKKMAFLLFPCIILISVSCKPSKEKSALKIQTLEQSLYSPSASSFSKSKADSLVVMYEDFANRFPGDSLSPSCLFKAANVTMNLGNGQKALDLFDRVLEKYPKYQKAPLCLFFKGYVYENLLHDLVKAKETYLQFIENYPTNEFAQAAQASIQNLGKTPEQMIREFELKQKADSTHKADSLAKTNPKGKKKGKS
jgi:outer membrane protein assembly factor BamD (BamD/ComL family)